uniref:Uncharacterized protein n=2 Tax=Magallana gigas TaxID=29159 RepID=A0A8W8N7E5_MAGGI
MSPIKKSPTAFIILNTDPAVQVDNKMATPSTIPSNEFIKRDQTLIEDIEEEKQLALFVGVVILGVFFAVVGAGLTMYWIYRKTHPGAYRHNRLDDLQRLQSTSSTNDDVKKTLA